MNDLLNITLKIAGLPPVGLTIERDREEEYRSAAKAVDHLYALLHQRFPDKNANELLALAAVQFARRNIAAEASLAEADATLGAVETALDRLLESGSAPVNQPGDQHFGER